jgi:hypothetical protein
LNGIWKIHKNGVSLHSGKRPSLDRNSSTASGTCHMTGFAVIVLILCLNAMMVAQKRSWSRLCLTHKWQESGERSRYIDYRRTGRPRGRGSSPGRVKNFLFSKSSRLALRSTQPHIQWVPGALSPGVKRPGREVDHSPTSAEVMKMWIYTSTPHTPSWRSA